MGTGGATVDGKNGPRIESVEKMVVRFAGELMTEVPEWKRRLREEPEALEDLERDVHATCASVDLHDRHHATCRRVTRCVRREVRQDRRCRIPRLGTLGE